MVTFFLVHPFFFFNSLQDYTESGASIEHKFTPCRKAAEEAVLIDWRREEQTISSGSVKSGLTCSGELSKSDSPPFSQPGAREEEPLKVPGSRHSAETP